MRNRECESEGVTGTKWNRSSEKVGGRVERKQGSEVARRRERKTDMESWGGGVADEYIKWEDGEKSSNRKSPRRR